MDSTSENKEIDEKLLECKKATDNLSVDKRATEEEFQNFMHRVTEIEKIVKKLASNDLEEQRHGQMLADEILKEKVQKEFTEVEDLIVKSNRTVINKSAFESDATDPNKMERDVFMKSVETDARKRAEDRKIRNERAETLKRIANGAFKGGDYEKAVTYFSKAIEQRKDSSVLWNNRALSYMHLELYEKALSDCEWALKVNDSNIKALLNSAKCHKYLNNEEKYKEYIRMARERNSHYSKLIDDFEESLNSESNVRVDREIGDV